MSQKRKLVSNSVSMLVNKLVQGGTSFLLTASIARTLGAQVLGQYLLAVSYHYIFVNIFSQGLKTSFTREVSLHPEKTSTYLVSGTLLQLILSVIAYASMVLVVYLLPYSSNTSWVCYILGLTIIPFALSNITEAILQAQEKMHLIAISTVPFYILRVSIMIGVMIQHFGIEYVAGIFVISELVIFIVQWLLLINIVKPVWKINQDFIWNSLRSARTLFAIEGMGIVASRIDILSLSLLGSEFALGLYGAVGQLMQPFTLVSRSLALAAFPRMSKAVQFGKEQQRQEAENTLRLLLGMGLPFFVAMLVFSNEILIFVYNDSNFLQANTILKIFSFMLIPNIFSLVFSYILIANGLEKFTLIEVSITTIIGGLSSIVLITSYQLMGAALTVLIMSISSFAVIVFAMYKYLFLINLGQVIRLPLLVSGSMLIAFLILKSSKIDFLYTIIISTTFYLILVALLVASEFGGLNRVWRKLLKKG
jgi:O-antigen/teichoic acid export membrane protein